MAKFFLLVFALLTFLGAPFFFFGEHIEQFFSGGGLIVWLQARKDFAWLAAIGLLIADLMLPIPTTAVMASLGMIYGPLIGGSISVIGSIISGLLGYILCRYLGRPFAIWLTNEHALSEGEKIFQHMGGWLVAMSRWLPMASEIVACLAGLLNMRVSIFLLALFCGSLPLGFVFSYIGHLGIDYPIQTLILSAVLPFFLWLGVQKIIKS